MCALCANAIGEKGTRILERLSAISDLRREKTQFLGWILNLIDSISNSYQNGFAYSLIIVIEFTELV